MPDAAIFERKTMGGQHVIVAKALPGFLVSAPTAEEAERRFPALLAHYLAAVAETRGAGTAS